MHLYEKRGRIKNKDLIFALLVFVLLIALFSAAFSGVADRSGARGDELVENAIRRAVVTCYAIEGRYPESLSYLVEHYGVVVDESQYYVSYEVFAENVMPGIRVLPKGGTS